MIFIALILDVLAYHGFIAMLSNRTCENPSVQNSPPHNCYLTCGQRLNISRAVTLFNILTIFVTRMLVPTELENGRDPCPSLSPKTLFGSAPQFPNIPLSKSHQPCRRTLLVGTLPEIPSGTSAPLRCNSYGYIRSSTKITPQAAGNSTRRH